MTCRCTLGVQSTSIWRSAAASASVAVKPHSILIATQSVAYWHQWALLGGRHSSGPLRPFERFEEAVTAIRWPGYPRLLA